MISTLKRRLTEMGPHFDQEVLRETLALYRPLVPRRSERVRVQQDVPYGPQTRQCFDLYVPVEAVGLPVVIYVPGGGFVGGDKRAEDGFYANIGHHFADRGYVVLIMNYRLAPNHPWPAGGVDVGYAMAWAREHVAAHGGDPERIAVFGQSAGATHVLTWLFDPVVEGTKTASAIVLASGTYRISGDKASPNILAYFGADSTQYEARSPITHVCQLSVPILLTVSELDPPFLASPTLELAAKLTNVNGRSPQLNWLAGHNHVSNVLSIGTPDSDVATLLGDFLRSSLM